MAERLSPAAADYWQLRATSNQAAAIELEAIHAAEGFKRRIAAQHERAKELLTKIGGDPSKPYRYEDATCELIPVEDEKT